jgi:hypothetical protein
MEFGGAKLDRTPHHALKMNPYTLKVPPDYHNDETQISDLSIWRSRFSFICIQEGIPRAPYGYSKED